MRRRIIGVLIAALALAGLIIATPQAAQAFPKQGTRTARIDGCTNGAVTGDVFLTWTTVYTSTTTGYPNPYDYNYSVQLTKVEYKAAPGVTNNVTGIVPLVRLGVNIADAYMIQTGTSGSGEAMTGSPLPDGSTKTNGVGGVSWPTRNLSTPTDDTFRNYIKVNWKYRTGNGTNWAYSSCDSDPVYLDEVDSIPAGANQSAQFSCDPGDDGTGAKDALILKYDVTNTNGGNPLSFKIAQALYSNGPGTLHGPPNGISLNLVHVPGSSPAVPVDSGSSQWTGPTSVSFNEADGVNGVSFPTRSINYVAGDWYRLEATFHHGPLEGGDCTAAWYLNRVWTGWTGGGQSGSEYTGDGFVKTYDISIADDCAGSPVMVDYEVRWQWDVNRQYVRPVRMSISNRSQDAKLVVPAGTASSEGGITWEALAGNPVPTSANKTTFKGSLADGTVNPATGPTTPATKTISLTDYSKWVRMDGVAGPTPPSSNAMDRGRNPALHLNGIKMYVAVGTHAGEYCGNLRLQDLTNPFAS